MVERGRVMVEGGWVMEGGRAKVEGVWVMVGYAIAVDTIRRFIFTSGASLYLSTSLPLYLLRLVVKAALASTHCKLGGMSPSIHLTPRSTLLCLCICLCEMCRVLLAITLVTATGPSSPSPLRVRACVCVRVCVVCMCMRACACVALFVCVYLTHFDKNPNKPS